MNRLFLTYYAERRRERAAELDLSLLINATVFDRVFVLSEGVGSDPPANVTWRVMDRRQTYRDAMDWAAAEAGASDVSVIANCDIMIPAPAVRLLESSLPGMHLMCLSRHEPVRAKAVLYDMAWSQDVWAFRGRPPDISAAFPFGVPGCDNRIAYEFHAAGWTVSNPSRDIVTYHVHQSQRRTPTNTRQYRVPPPYLFVKPHHIGETAELRFLQPAEYHENIQGQRGTRMDRAGELQRAGEGPGVNAA